MAKNFIDLVKDINLGDYFNNLSQPKQDKNFKAAKHFIIKLPKRGRRKWGEEEGAGDERGRRREGKEEEKGRKSRFKEIFKAVIDKWHMTSWESSWNSALETTKIFSSENIDNETIYSKWWKKKKPDYLVEFYILKKSPEWKWNKNILRGEKN